MRNWLFLRGEFDHNNRRSLDSDSDMWIQLFAEIVGCDDHGYIWYNSGSERIFHYKSNIWVITKSTNDLRSFDVVLARGGFEYYIPILKKCRNAYKVYYGAGKRIFPQDKINYEMILVDCEEDLKIATKKYPQSKVILWTKPCARHYMPVDVEKKYDVCYVAPNPKDERKRCEWVYKTAPEDLRILQLGNEPHIKPPKNIKVKRVASTKMPKVISKCKVTIAPYSGNDSAPRIITESMACGVPVVCSKDVKLNWGTLNYEHNIALFRSDKKEFWNTVRKAIKKLKTYHPSLIAGNYQAHLSLEKEAVILREKILNEFRKSFVR